MQKSLFIILTFLSFFFSCMGQSSSTIGTVSKASQDSIIEKYLRQCAWKHPYFSKEWNTCIDEGLKQDSTIAYLWQQKAMPLFKQRKYEPGLQYLDKAVLYDKSWLNYRAFMKCIFVKSYSDALLDFQECKKTNPYGRLMDHSYEFFMALCYLQLNEFQTALSVLKADLDRTRKEKSEDWVHHLDLFYLGIIYYELKDYDKAIVEFDKALLKYPNFSDVKYFKGQCLILKGDYSRGIQLMTEAKKDFEKGYTINEDNAIYEPYPYQVNWKLVQL